MKVRSTAAAVCVCGPKKVKLVKHGLYTTNGKPNPLINNNILFWGKMGKSGEALSERPSLLGQLVKQVKNELYMSVAITKLLINKDIVLWGCWKCASPESAS